MTKEEAIEYLKLIRLNAGMTGSKSFEEVLNLAIESLSKPSLPSNLDEAAEEEYPDFSNSIASKAAVDSMRGAFKAGATWRDAQIPKLPDNVDEAAEAIAEKYATRVFGEVGTNDHIDHNGRNECRALYIIGCIEGFKAGTEWQLNEDSEKHYFTQLKDIKDAWQELKKNNPEIENKPAVCFHRGAEWMTGQFQKIEGELVDWYSTSDGKDYCCGVKTQDAFEVPEGFYIKKK